LLVGLSSMVALAMVPPKTEAELDAAHEWAEPEYTSEPAFLETSGKLRGVPITVHPRKGMVTYISPAKKLQRTGLVYQPPPSVQIIQSHPPPPTPVFVQPLVSHHVDHHINHAVPVPVALNDVPYWSQYDHWPHGHDHHDMDWVNGRHLNLHRHHRHIHPATPGPVHVVPRYGIRPVGVPSSLFAQPVHRPHYGHSASLSQGSITVPAGPVAVESPQYTGYNAGFPIQTHSAPTAYWSDGTPHGASMMQYGGTK